MAAASADRCGSTRLATMPPRSATRRCCLPRARRAGSRATEPPASAPQWRPEPQMVLLDDGFQNPGDRQDLVARRRRRRLRLRQRAGDPGRPVAREPRPRACPRRRRRAARRRCAAGLLGSRSGSAGLCRSYMRFCAPVAGERLAGARLLAFAGIGRPEKFFATLRALGAELVGTRAFPDHHPYRAGEIDRLLRDAERAQARLVTTAKDIVRVPPANASRDRGSRGRNPLG